MAKRRSATDDEIRALYAEYMADPLASIEDIAPAEASAATVRNWFVALDLPRKAPSKRPGKPNGHTANPRTISDSYVPRAAFRYYGGRRRRSKL
jgi:hypothetical protein